MSFSKFVFLKNQQSTKRFEMFDQKPLVKGKTKTVWSCVDNEHLAELQSRDDITAGNGIKHDIIENKGAFSTQTTVQCFKLLKKEGVSTHFVSCNLTEENDVFIARRCEMIPIEVVARRFAFGSYLKRYPHVAKETRFETPLVEFFLKDDKQNDPFIIYQGLNMWYPYSASEEFHAGPKNSRHILFGSDFFKSERVLSTKVIAVMQQTARLVFLVLEKAWKERGHTLIDMKIEFGFDFGNDELLVADVIDNDSWRLRRDKDGKEMSKQAYRDGASLEEVRRNYFEIAVSAMSFL